MPYFSIIIPSYNRASIIARAIDSVLNQAFPDFELIIVDDGSTDDTDKIILGYLKDSRIKYFNKENAGVCAARNFGAKQAKGKYLIFLDSDDEVKSTWLNDFYALAKDDQYDVIYCGFMVEWEKAELIDSKKKTTDSQIIPDNIAIAGSFLLLKSFFFNAGMYDEKIRYGENTELGMRVNMLKPRIGNINKFNLIYHKSFSGGGKDILNRIESNYYLLSKHADFYNKNSAKKSQVLSIIAVDLIKAGKIHEARKVSYLCLKGRPFSVKAYARFFLVIFLFYPYRKYLLQY